MIYATGELRVAYQCRLFEVVVFNTGPALASGIEVADELELEFEETSTVGATIIWGEDPIVLPPGADFVVSQPELTRSQAAITLPDLNPGDAHTLRFWTISYWATTSNAPIDLVNSADVSTSSIDSNPLNNSASVTVVLQP